MNRTIYKRLIDWKLSKTRKPLILHGARQVGKTWVLTQFGKNEYSKFAYINCDSSDSVRTIFNADSDIDRIIKALSALSGVDITPGDTLVFIDEAQDCPQAVATLKYFYEQAPDIHIAVAGSLLGLTLHESVSFPVGKVETLFMYPMTFAEFLEAKGEHKIVSLLEEADYETLDTLCSRMTTLLREYFFVGGMPEVVRAWTEGKGPNEIRSIQKEILLNYESDFSKHAPTREVPRIRMVWNSIPAQLAKENKKFVYGAVRKGARASEFEMAIQWLTDAGLLYRIHRCKALQMPLKFYEDFQAFKLFMLDCGLLGALADTPPQAVLIGDDIFKEYKGAFTEQYVAQQIKALCHTTPYYYSSDTSRMEIDFVMQVGNSVLPIEVKASGNVRANSLHRYLETHPDLQAIRLSLLPYKQQSNLTNIPLYSLSSLLANLNRY